MAEIKLGEQIAFLRKQNKMTQEALAEALGVTNQAVSKWESAQCCPDISILPDIAELFGVSVDELIERTPTKSERQKGIDVLSTLDGQELVAWIKAKLAGMDQ